MDCQKESPEWAVGSPEKPSRFSACQHSLSLTRFGSGATKRPLYEKVDLTTDPAAQLELHECVERLPDDQRTVFELRFYQGMKQVEVAKLLGVAEKTVSNRWLKARSRLADALEIEAPKSHGEA